MKPSTFLIAGLGFALLAGCDTKSPPGALPPSDLTAVKQTTPPPPAQKADAPETKPPPTPEIDRSKLPASLQSDAYHYFGLNNDKPVNIQITNSPDGTVLTGSSANTLTKVENGVATFQQTTTGEINEKYGNQTVELRSDGVYAVHADKIKVEKPQLTLPTGLGAGKSWTVDTPMELNNDQVRQHETYTCQGEVDVESGGQKFQAMLVTGVGTLTGIVGKGPAEVSEKEWFVRDMGLIKSFQKLVQTGKGGKTVTVTMELQPPTKGGEK